MNIVLQNAIQYDRIGVKGGAYYGDKKCKCHGAS